MWQIKNFISPLSQGLWTRNLAWWWLRVRRPHLQIHMTLQYRGHVTNKKRYISTLTRPMDPKTSRVVTQDEGTSSTNSHDTSTTWSRVKSKTFYLHIHKAPGPQNVVECWIRMRGTHLKSHCVIMWKIKNVIFLQPQCCRDVKGKLVLAKINTKMPTKTKNVEMK